ncbi:MAG TPA: response regulator [Candidatus Krumholzibacteria bacterium]|nr:response regulator [Candidatus Krumholzibacteria bacterium]HRX49839.1 response regulator [Candidatus Krumholzibacteria bacterium]
MDERRIKILCVDDEPLVLDGLTLHLRRRYEVRTATNGAEGLSVLNAEGPFAVVLSDMRMPGMDGAEFLSRVRAHSPDATRMLLTGHADIPSTVAAVNEGRIFRFLTKPCPPDQILDSFAAAVEQHDLVVAEKVLLEQTLRGSIAMLTDVLAMTSPMAFGRGSRLRDHCARLAGILAMPKAWEVEVAAMLALVGAVSLPEETTERYFRGEALSEPEQAMVAKLPEVTESLLGHIPRLDGVRAILRDQHTPASRMERREIPLGSRILRAVCDFDDLESSGMAPSLALDTLRNREGEYDPVVLAAFTDLLGDAGRRREVREVTLAQVRQGMVFIEDVRTKTGALLVARGFVVTPGFLQKARNFAKDLVPGMLKVLVRVEQEAEQPEPATAGGDR